MTFAARPLFIRDADPYWSSVVALLNMPGSQGGTVFVDSTGLRTWTPGGTAHIDTSLGYNTARFDGGASGAVLTTAYKTGAFDWWTSDFTVEAYVMAAGFSTAAPNLLGNMEGGGDVNYWSFGPLASGRLEFYYWTGGQERKTSAATVPSGVLSHISMCHSGGNIYLSINGAVEAMGARVGAPQSSEGTPMTIGRYQGVGIDGYVKAVRITKGVARYTATFSPPAAPFPTAA